MPTSNDTTQIPYGYCQCGCGKQTSIANKTSRARGIIKGEPCKFMKGHSGTGYTYERAFWSKVDENGSIPQHMPHLGKCWEWKGAVDSYGYGYSSWIKAQLSAHRISWLINNGDIPDGLWVLHKCDNRKCVNPTHLWIGTNTDNVNDKMIKGRYIKGEASHFHKLTLEQVIQIRLRYSAGDITQRELGTEFNISRSEISLIVNRKKWNHV